MPRRNENCERSPLFGILPKKYTYACRLLRPLLPFQSRGSQEAALKDSQADDRQDVDRHDKDQQPFQPTFPIGPRTVLSNWLNSTFLATLHITKSPSPCNKRSAAHQVTQRAKNSEPLVSSTHHSLGFR